MDLESTYIDELIDLRKEARAEKNWQLADEIRNYLDTKLVFIFDAQWGQEVYYLTEKYFEAKNKRFETILMNPRQYVEHKIKKDLNVVKSFEAWLYSMRKSVGLV